MAMMNIYVGNLSLETTESELEKLFAQYGQVNKVNIIRNYETGRSQGFVEMDSESAQTAITELDGTELDGRILIINQARERDRFSERNIKR